MTLDLIDDEAVALTALPRRTIDENRYPLSPRLAPVKAILAKLDPPAARAEPRPPRLTMRLLRPSVGIRHNP